MRDYASVLKDWRQTRRLSQMALALEAGVSARHIAFIETRRARPSREMVLRLADVLEVPRPERNAMLGAAGFAPHYPALPLDDAAMAPVRAAMDWTISRHAPYPAVVMDRLWRLIALNDPAQLLFAPTGLGAGDSLLDAMAEGGLAHFVENWDEVGHHTMLRLRAESARAGGIAALDRAAAALARDPAIAGFTQVENPGAVLPTIYRAGDLRLSLFSTYAQFGTAEEVALSEMKIELMFPADVATRTILEALAAGQS